MTKHGRSWWLVLGGLTCLLVACKSSPAPAKAPVVVKEHFPCKDAASCHADCAVGLDDGCVREAMVYEIGIGVPIDAPRAVKLYRGLCDRGVQEACADLGWFLTDPGAQHDQPAGLALLAKTCDSGGARACQLAALQETMRNDGRDTAKSLELEARAAKLYFRDCEAGVYNACGDVKLDGPDAKAAVALLDSRCKQGSAAACGNLGSNHVFGATDDAGTSLVPENGPRAAELMEDACKRVGQGCRFLAEMYDDDDPKGTPIRTLACDAWDATSCWKIGKKDRACDLGHARACNEVGREVRL